MILMRYLAPTIATRSLDLDLPPPNSPFLIRMVSYSPREEHNLRHKWPISSRSVVGLLFDKVKDLAMGCARADDGKNAGHILVFAMRDHP